MRCRTLTARLSKFPSEGRDQAVGFLDGVLYWEGLPQACRLLPFLALGTKHTPRHPDNQTVPQHSQTPLGPWMRVSGSVIEFYMMDFMNTEKKKE